MIDETLSNISINAHSSIHIAGTPSIYFDPFKIETKSHDADYIFITHKHYDHFSPEDIDKVQNEKTIYVAPKSMKEELEKAGINPRKTLLLEAGQYMMNGPVTIQTVPAYNTNKPMHKKEYGWLGYVVTVDGVSVYVSGDIDAIPEGERVTADIAMIPIGGTYTMNPQEAAEFINRMMPGVAIPTHYGCIVGDPLDADTFAQAVNPKIPVHKKISF